MRISDWSSDVCSSDLGPRRFGEEHRRAADGAAEREAAEKITTFDHAGDTYDAAAGLQAGGNISRFARAAHGNRGRTRRGSARARPGPSPASPTPPFTHCERNGKPAGEERGGRVG